MTTIKNRHTHRVSLIPATTPFRICVRFLLCALMLISSAACTDQNEKDDPDNPGFETGIPTEVCITLSSRSGNGTRAEEDAEEEPDGEAKDPNASIEYIHDWWIAFVDRNNKVTVVDRNSALNHSIGPDVEEFEAETFKCVIPTGHYKIYAFANINIPKKADGSVDMDVVQSFISGSKNLEEALASSGSAGAFVSNKMQWPATITKESTAVKNYIPMTGFIEDAYIRNTMEETFSIEVIRAVAKVEFEFTNPTDEIITLKSLQFGPITSTDVSLFPDYAALGYHAYTPLSGAQYGFPSFDLKVPNVVASGSEVYKTLAKDLPWNFQFYCKESLAPSVSADADKTNNVPATTKDLFTIFMKVDKTTNGTTASDVERTLYTTVVKDYINRNDWIHIPIKFNDWTIYWKLHSYPPIGGYPPVFKQNADGSSMYATLTTGGEFELYPYMIKQNNDANNTNYFDKVDWDNTGMEVDLVSGTDNLFVNNEKPKIVGNPNVSNHPLGDKAGEFPKIIMGELDPMKEGTAQLKITFYLKDTKFSGTVFTCIFTIHRQNGSYSGS